MYRVAGGGWRGGVSLRGGLRLPRGGPVCAVAYCRGFGRGTVCRLALGLALRRLLRPVLVELDAPLAVLGLLQAQLGPERAPRPAAEACDRLGGAPYRRIV